MLCEVPLTKEQQDFAAEHHGLVYKFLNDNHLPENEFYDVVIFPYLKAVKDYFSDESAQHYSFAAIAMHRMRLCIYDYFRSQARRKRNAEVISIHLGLYPDGVPLEDVLPGQDRLMQEFEMQQMLHDLASHVSEQQMKIVRMKGYGYGIREISSHEKIPMKRIQELLDEVHTVFLRLCRE